MSVRVRQARARGRRGLLWAAAIVVGVQLGTSLVLDRFGTPVRFPELVRVLRVAATEPPPDVLFLGSSRTEAGIDPALISDLVRRDTGDPRFHAFNAGIAVGDTLAQNRMQHEMLCQGRRPAIAVLEVGPEFLNATNYRMPEHIRRQTRWQDLPGDLPEAWRSHRLPRLFLSYLVPLDVHRFHLLKEAGRLWEQGWPAWQEDYALAAPFAEEPAPPAQVPTPADNARLLTAALEESWSTSGLLQAGNESGATRNPAFHPGVMWVASWLSNFEIGGQSAACLEEMLERCRRQGIVPILLQPPVCAEQRELYTPQIDAVYQGHVRGLCERYGCVLVDARAWCRDEDFRDNHHLNKGGEQRFSARFAHEVLAPVWKARRAASDVP